MIVMDTEKVNHRTVSLFSLKVVMYFILVRLAILVATSLFNATPFLCYDDFVIYDKITVIKDYEIKHWLNYRNCYYWICNVLNSFRIGEYVTGTRILNIVLWLVVCFKINTIATYLGYSVKNVKAITLFMAVSPVYAFYSMVPLREVLCTWAVLSLIELFLKYEKDKKFAPIRTIFFAIALFFLRTGILEMILIVFLWYKFKDGKPYVKVLLVLFSVAALAFFITNQNYMYVINNKFEYYLMTESSLQGMLSFIEVKKATDFYKLVFLLPFVQLIPLPGSYDALYTASSWSNWISMFACLQAFIFPFFWIYVFKAQKSREEKVILLFYFIALIILALSQPNNPRFFFFISPIFFIFGVNSFLNAIKRKRSNLLLGVAFSVVPYLYLLI